MVIVPTLQLKKLSYREVIPKVTNLSRGVVRIWSHAVWCWEFMPFIASVPASLGRAPHPSPPAFFSACSLCVPGNGMARGFRTPPQLCPYCCSFYNSPYFLQLSWLSSQTLALPWNLRKLLPTLNLSWLHLRRYSHAVMVTSWSFECFCSCSLFRLKARGKQGWGLHHLDASVTCTLSEDDFCIEYMFPETILNCVICDRQVIAGDCFVCCTVCFLYVQCATCISTLKRMLAHLVSWDWTTC